MRTRLALALALLPLALAACTKELVCPAGETACGSHCVSLLTDQGSCGACGHACGAAMACVAGTCACGPGTAACGAACADLASDPAHCGACGTACAPADVCSASACAATCAAGLTDCGRACVDLQADRYDCGACGVACAQGETCRAGACRADLQVACYATDDVRAVTADLAPAGPARAAGSGPISLALQGGSVYAANSLSHSLSTLPLDPRLAGTETVLGGSDFELVTAHDGLLWICSSGTGTLVVFDPAAGRVVDEIVLGATDVNPRGVGFVGTRAFVSLYGKDELSGGQSIAILDVSGVAACTQPDPAPPACGTGGACPAGRTCRAGACVLQCGQLASTIPLKGVAGASDAPGLPFPARVAVAGSRVLVTLANLKKATTGALAGYYVDPAGPGKLAVIDTAAGDALSFVELGACEDPFAIALDGSKAWIACTWSGGPGLLPVDVSGAPAPGALLPVAVGAPGNLAFCGGMGYVTDQWSGTVLRFDPSGVAPALPATVCPNSAGPYGWAWAADVACAE